MKTCPQCGLHNPDDGTICACGFDLVHGDAASVRGVLRRRGRAYQFAGLAVIVWGLLGGTALLPVHLSFFVIIQDYNVDVIVIVLGAILLAKGSRLVKRPWTEK